MTNFSVSIGDMNKPKPLEIGQVRFNETGDVILIGSNNVGEFSYIVLAGDSKFDVEMIAVNEKLITYGYPFVAETVNITINE